MADGASSAGHRQDVSAEGLHWLMNELAQKERSLLHRETTIAAREADLRLAEQKIEERLAALESLRAEIRTEMTAMDEAREQRVVGLVRMFEGMRPGDAAAILSEPEEDISIAVLDRMARSKAGKVLAEMEPQKAARLAATFADSPRLPATAADR